MEEDKRTPVHCHTMLRRVDDCRVKVREIPSGVPCWGPDIYRSVEYCVVVFCSWGLPTSSFLCTRSPARFFFSKSDEELNFKLMH